MKFVYVSVIVLLAVVACSQLAMAQIPRTISYQGVLADNTGTPKPDGSYQLTFRLYDVGTGGSALWTEVKTLLTTRGLFSTALGDQVPLPYSIKFDQPYWLGIQVAADPELTTRIPLTAVGYSFNSSWADTARVGLVSIETIDTLYVGSPTMNGFIKLYQNGSTNPIVTIQNDGGDGGQIRLYDPSGAITHSLEGDASGVGGYMYIYRNTISRGFQVDGNYNNLHEPEVAILGSRLSARFNLSHTANAAVILPDSSISSEEILDEPGVAVSYNGFFGLAGVTTNQVVDSVNITVPASGKVIVQATGYVNISHTTGTDETITLNVSDNIPGNITTYGCAKITIPSGLPTDVYRYPITCQKIFNAPTANSLLKFYLMVQQSQITSACGVWWTAIKAIYYPTTYGSTPVVVTNFNQTQEGDGSFSEIVTYQSAEEFKTYKKQIFQAELDQLKAQVKSLEQKLNDDSDR